MSAMTENLIFIEALTSHLDRLKELLGDDWPAFRQKLEGWLVEIPEAKTDEKLSFIVDEIIDLGINSPAADLVRALLRQAGEEAGHVDSTTRSVKMLDPTSGETR